MPTALQADHDARVRDIAAELARAAREKAPVHIHKGGVHHFVPLPGDARFRGRAIDVSPLRRVLAIDPASRRCVVEPGITFLELVRATLPHGLMPAVVPELSGITVGGAIAGCSVESMSYRYGGFHDRCLAYEVVTTSGEILRVSRDHEPLAFEMLHGSYGTLGVLTQVTFELVPAKPYVRMEYLRYSSAEALRAAMRARIEGGGQDFIDGIAHGPSEWILCVGHFADHAPYTSDYRAPPEGDGRRIFYKSTRDRTEDFLTTEGYCFRYDAECHWLTKTVPPLEWAPVRQAIGRWFLGSTNLITWSKRLEPILGLKRRPDVVVDVFIPEPRFTEFAAWYERSFDFWPLWLVPYHIPKAYPWVTKSHAEKIGALVIDCAIYGKTNGEVDVDYSSLLEEKTFELGGIKTLISSNHYDEDRFWTIYDRTNYLAAKARLDPVGLFPGLYDKFHRRRA